MIVLPAPSASGSGELQQHKGLTARRARPPSSAPDVHAMMVRASVRASSSRGASTPPPPRCSPSGSGLEMLLQASRSNSRNGQVDGADTPELEMEMETENGSEMVMAQPVELQAVEGQASSSSVIIVGMPGVGKSTLAVIAATNLECPLIDIDRTLAHRFQMPVTSFIRQHGEQRFRELESELLFEILASLRTATSQRQHIIACGGGICDSQANREQIRAFRDSGGRVIHVHRDKTVVVPSLRHSSSIVFGDDEVRVRDLWHSRTPLYEEVASHTFVNLSIDIGGQTNVTLSKSASSALSLKPVERDFLRFLKFVLAIEPNDLLPTQARDPSHLVRIDHPRPYNLDAASIHQATRGASAIELCLHNLVSGFSPPPTPHADRNAIQHLTAAHSVAYIRRHTDLPIICTLHSQGIGGIASYNQLGESSYVANIVKACRLGVEAIAIDSQLSDDALSTIQTARSPAGRFLHCYRLDSAGPANWQIELVLQAVNLATARGADLVRIATSPADPRSIFSVAHLTHPTHPQHFQKTVPLILETIGPYCRSTSLVNRCLSPISHPATSASISEDLPTFEEVQQLLVISGLHLSKNIYVPYNRRAHIKAYDIFDAGLQSLGLPLRLVPLAGQMNDGTALRVCGLIVDGEMSKSTKDSSTEIARFTGRFSIMRSNPPLYDNLFPAALANVLTRGLSPVNAITSRSIALVVGAYGARQLEVLYALRIMKVKNVILLHSEALPDERTRALGMELRTLESAQSIRRNKPSLVVVSDSAVWDASAIDSHVLASPTGGCAIDLGDVDDQNKGKTMPAPAVAAQGWNVLTSEDLAGALIKLEFHFLTSFHLPVSTSA